MLRMIDFNGTSRLPTMRNISRNVATLISDERDREPREERRLGVDELRGEPADEDRERRVRRARTRFTSVFALGGEWLDGRDDVEPHALRRREACRERCRRGDADVRPRRSRTSRRRARRRRACERRAA